MVAIGVTKDGHHWTDYVYTSARMSQDHPWTKYSIHIVNNVGWTTMNDSGFSMVHWTGMPPRWCVVGVMTIYRPIHTIHGEWQCVVTDVLR